MTPRELFGPHIDCYTAGARRAVMSLAFLALIADPGFAAGAPATLPTQARLDPVQARQFGLDYLDAAGPDLLNLRAVIGRLFVPDAKLRRALGRDALRRRVWPACRDATTDECDENLLKTVGGADFERFYYAEQEQNLLLRTFVIYGHAFEEARVTGSYVATPEDEMIDEVPRRLIAEYEKKNADVRSPAEAIEALESLNRAMVKHFRDVYQKYPLVGDVIGKVREAAPRGEGFEKTLRPGALTRPRNYGRDVCPEPVCRTLRSYYEIDGFKLYRDPRTGRLKAYDYKVRLVLF